MVSDVEKIVYLDYNATTPYAESVKAKMLTAFDCWGNPSSSYQRGKAAKTLIEESRLNVAEMIEAKKSEIIFVSGGTEANNVAIRTAVGENRQIPQPHVVSTSIEHDATLKLLEYMISTNEITATFVQTNSDGSVDSNVVGDSVKEETVLITLMLANNETGAILNLKKLTRTLEEINLRRARKGLHRVLLHIDAAQALGKIPVSVLETPVDFMTIVGHKFYGPRIGALYVREGLPVKSLVKGGGQEGGKRSGTENVLCITGLGEAARLVKENVSTVNERFSSQKARLKVALEQAFPNNTFLANFPETPDRPQLPNTLSVSFPGLVGREILNNCPNLEASTGAACHSTSQGKCASGMLMKLLPEKQAVGSIRLSLGRETTEDDITLAVQYLKEAVSKLN